MLGIQRLIDKITLAANHYMEQRSELATTPEQLADSKGIEGPNSS